MTATALVALGMAADTDDDNDGILDTADGLSSISLGSLTDTMVMAARMTAIAPVLP